MSGGMIKVWRLGLCGDSGCRIQGYTLGRSDSFFEMVELAKAYTKRGYVVEIY